MNILRKIITIAGFVTLGFAVGGFSAKASDPFFKEEMQAFAHDYFTLRPETALYYGVPFERSGTEKLTHYRPADEQNRRAAFAALVEKLGAMKREGLTPQQVTSLDLIQFEMENALKPAETVSYGSILGEYGNWFLPYSMSHLSGPHVEVPTLLEDKVMVTNIQDAKAYVHLLAEYADILGEIAAKVQGDAASGVIAPDFVLANIIENLSGDIEKGINHTLITSFTAKMQVAGVEGSAAYEEQAKTVFVEKVIPALDALRSVLAELKEKATHDAGIYHQPNGKALYRAMITHLTDTAMEPEEIHALGLREVARIHSEMDILLKKIGYDAGTVGERMQKLLVDPKYIYPNTDEGKAALLGDLRADLDLVNAELPKWFGLLPDQDVEIKAVPKHREQSVSGAFYDAPAFDGSSPGTFWVSLYDTAANPSYSLQTLVYHEANPGHHLQTVIGMSGDQPVLSTVFYSNAAGEGWGLYAERLAADMGIYKNDPVDDIGRLQAELLRAVRLVVDTGMHEKGWSREQAIDYMVAAEGVHMDEAVGEIERYAVWPGQALGYKLGELKIVEMRSLAKKTLGERFDVRAFHDRVLEDGALPLVMLEAKLRGWIAAQAQ
ncbi:DUF885 domain-containing protein [Kordiimonas pumila]|uniref:DUF885 domain-containing protein n=1 Tax=Kordiimonas pumila TaxID=2161677 RepID=A0ABV7D0F5_9PROT|nr:DUF885 domain-containing protein [Kordiimonas pumila]